MSKEKIEITVVTYKEERLNYFTALYEKAKNKFDRLFKKHKDAPYLSDEFQKLSDAGHEAEFLGDVVKMLKQIEGEWKAYPDEHEICATEFVCSVCKESFATSEMTDWEFIETMKYCPNCGAHMRCLQENNNESGERTKLVNCCSRASEDERRKR